MMQTESKHNIVLITTVLWDYLSNKNVFISFKKSLLVLTCCNQFVSYNLYIG